MAILQLDGAALNGLLSPDHRAAETGMRALHDQSGLGFDDWDGLSGLAVGIVGKYVGAISIVHQRQHARGPRNLLEARRCHSVRGPSVCFGWPILDLRRRVDH